MRYAAQWFSPAARLACMSCHRVGQVGGAVGPDLSALAKDKTLDNIVESVLWPQRESSQSIFLGRF
ncbi:MAG: c-type cytochrome [Pirellulaceae bacterium]